MKKSITFLPGDHVGPDGINRSYRFKLELHATPGLNYPLSLALTEECSKDGVEWHEGSQYYMVGLRAQRKWGLINHFYDGMHRTFSAGYLFASWFNDEMGPDEDTGSPTVNSDA